MSQQNNPYAKFTPDPRKVPDPKTITIDQLRNYHSHEMNKLKLSWSVHRKSLLYIGGCVGFMFLTSFFAEKAARSQLFGVDSNKLIIQNVVDLCWT